MAITLAEAVVKVKMDDTVYKKQLSALGSQLNKFSGFLSKKILLPSLALGGKGIFDYLKTTDKLAKQTNAAINTLKFSFKQFSFRLGEVIIQKFRLVEVIGKLSKALNSLNAEKIDKILDVIKWTAVSAIILKVASSLLTAAGAINSIRNGIIAIEATKGVGAVAKGVGKGYGPSIAQGAATGGAGAITWFIVAMRKAWFESISRITKYYEISFNRTINKTLRASLKSAQGPKPDLFFKSFTKLLSMKMIREQKSLQPVELLDPMKNTKSLISFKVALGGLFAVLKRWAIIELAIHTLGKVFETFGFDVSTLTKGLKLLWDFIKTFASKLWSALGVLSGMMDLLLSPIKAVINIIIDSLSLLVSALSFNAKTISEAWKKFGDNFYKNGELVTDSLDKIKSNWNDWWNTQATSGQAKDKKVFAESIGTTGLEGLNQVFQDFYSQTMMLELEKEQVSLLKQIRDNTANNAKNFPINQALKENMQSAYTGNLKPTTYNTTMDAYKKEVRSGSVYASTMDMIRKQTAMPAF